MSLVHAICTQCGMNIAVDDSSEAAICKHCGSPIIIEKAIQRFNASNSHYSKDEKNKLIGYLYEVAIIEERELFLSEIINAHVDSRKSLEKDMQSNRKSINEKFCNISSLKKEIFSEKKPEDMDSAGARLKSWGLFTIGLAFFLYIPILIIYVVTAIFDVNFLWIGRSIFRCCEAIGNILMYNGQSIVSELFAIAICDFIQKFLSFIYIGLAPVLLILRVSADADVFAL